MKEVIVDEFAKEMLQYIEESPSCFHAVDNLKRILLNCGFSELTEGEKWSIKKGGKYFVTRNDSSIISFVVPKNQFKRFLITASHSDSPSFKIKENSQMKAEGIVKLNVEKYGGLILSPWFDRPLSVAGRLVVKGKSDFDVKSILVNIDRPLLMIPNLAIHMNKDVNKTVEHNVQNEMLPVFSCNGDNADFLSFVCNYAGVKPCDVLGHDLFLYNKVSGVFWGAENEFIASSRLDDLECVYSTFAGFLASCDSVLDSSAVALHCVFDNEEVGSGTKQGADSTFLKDTLCRLCDCLSLSSEEYLCLVANSFMISADNAHAYHPNYGVKSDPVNRPRVNGGIVIKYNASQKYCTDGVGSAIFVNLCKRAGVPYQTFTNRSDMSGGSTLGNISNAQVSLRGVDVGLAQWAMHSPYESAGAKDPAMLKKVCEVFYKGC